VAGNGDGVAAISHISVEEEFIQGFPESISCKPGCWSCDGIEPENLLFMIFKYFKLFRLLKGSRVPDS
jgi:hypothetical protein